MLKKDMIVKCKTLLHQFFLTPEDKQFIMSILLKHPRSADKIGCGMKDFFVGKGCFWIVRQDNSITDFSYIKCIRGKDNIKEDFSICCRATVSGDVFYMKIKLFNEKNINGYIICPISSEKVEYSNIHIDHYCPKFRDIVKSFIENNKIQITSEMFMRGDKQFGVKFRDIELANKFREYHNKIATYRLLSKTANVAIG
jgi:hypothetical protein